MTHTAEPAQGNTVDVDNIAFDRLATYETTNSKKQSGGKRRVTR